MFGKAVRRSIVVLIGLGIAALIVWALLPQPVPVDMAAIKRGPLEVTVEDEGITRIREVYTVSAPIGGKMLRSPREVGDKVVANKTLVAAIEPTRADVPRRPLPARQPGRRAGGAGRGGPGGSEDQGGQGRSSNSRATI